MDRITVKDLENVITRLNNLTGNPTKPWNWDDIYLKSNCGNYHLSQESGKVSLHRMRGEKGAVSDIFRCGHIPKRELYYRIHAYIDGFAASKYD